MSQAAIRDTHYGAFDQHQAAPIYSPLDSYKVIPELARRFQQRVSGLSGSMS